MKDSCTLVQSLAVVFFSFLNETSSFDANKNCLWQTFDQIGGNFLLPPFKAVFAL